MEKYYVCHFNFVINILKLLVVKFDTLDVYSKDDGFTYIASDQFNKIINWNVDTAYMSYRIKEERLCDSMSEIYKQLILRVFTD